MPGFGLVRRIADRCLLFIGAVMMATAIAGSMAVRELMVVRGSGENKE